MPGERKTGNEGSGGSRLEWCAGNEELGRGRGNGGFRWGGERYGETTVVSPVALSCFDWTSGFRSHVEDSEPSGRDRDRYSGPGEVGPWVRRASAPVPVHSPRHAGLGLADLSLGPGEYGWVARANDPQ